jgi:23S rRNA (guanosine2251-2'-O)-methyltransferase
MSVVTNLVREMEILQEHGFWIYGADMGGDDLHKVVFPQRTAIVMGAEGDGMSQLVSKRCDHLVSIPTTGHIDSLNVSVATGVLLYEVRRQQSIKKSL